MNDEHFLFEFKRFLDQRVDCRLDLPNSSENRIAELESEIEYFSDHGDRICALEDALAEIDRSQLLKDLTTIVTRIVHELASHGRLRIYVASPDQE